MKKFVFVIPTFDITEAPAYLIGQRLNARGENSIVFSNFKTSLQILLVESLIEIEKKQLFLIVSKNEFVDEEKSGFAQMQKCRWRVYNSFRDSRFIRISIIGRSGLFSTRIFTANNCDTTSYIPVR